MQLNQVKERSQEANGNRSRAPFQGARSLITIRSIESWSLLRSVALRSETPCPLSRCLPKIQPNRPNFPLPHPPPARAVRPRPSRLGARVGPSDRSLPPPTPGGGLKLLQALPFHTFIVCPALPAARTPFCLCSAYRLPASQANAMACRQAHGLAKVLRLRSPRQLS